MAPEQPVSVDESTCTFLGELDVHLVQLPPTLLWKGRTWCGRLGEPTDVVQDQVGPLCRSCVDRRQLVARRRR